VKSFDEPAADLTLARLQALRPGGSTRLGAALRHATRSLAQYRNGPRWVFVLSDGEPHDVDIHDPRYLVEDARHAVIAAGRVGVRMVCLVMAPDRATSARHIFGRQGAQPVHDIRDVPRALQRLMG
jgi:nitric oxide reductase activation protein